jgi:hypothetical protein
MLFTNSRAINRKTIVNNTTTKNSSVSLRPMFYSRSRVLQLPISNNPITPNTVYHSEIRTRIATTPVYKEITQTKRLRWGPPYWYFFHAIAEKVKEEHFLRIREELLNIIKLICQNLPCPDCSKHAIQYITQHHLLWVTSKDVLKNVLFHFHNTVNEKKGNPLFDRTELDAMYSKSQLIPIWDNFIKEFLNKSRNNRLMANDFHRESVGHYIRNWFEKNIEYFQL